MAISRCSSFSATICACLTFSSSFSISPAYLDGYIFCVCAWCFCCFNPFGYRTTWNPKLASWLVDFLIVCMIICVRVLSFRDGFLRCFLWVSGVLRWLLAVFCSEPSSWLGTCISRWWGIYIFVGVLEFGENVASDVLDVGFSFADLSFQLWNCLFQHLLILLFLLARYFGRLTVLFYRLWLLFVFVVLSGWTVLFVFAVSSFFFRGFVLIWTLIVGVSKAAIEVNFFEIEVLGVFFWGAVAFVEHGVKIEKLILK